MLRAEQLARLLRDTDVSIESAMRQVGWHSRGHAVRLFRQYIGVSPLQYRPFVSRPLPITGASAPCRSGHARSRVVR